MTALLPAANISADPATRFEIDPAVLIKAHKAARDGSPKIIGCYHSHPNGSAEPSMRDAEAAENGSVWVVIAGDTLTAWQFGAEGFVPLPILPS
jgi:proteasome lid subunit RPN8/RPN11